MNHHGKAEERSRLTQTLERADKVLEACRQRGIDPIVVLERAVRKHDRQYGER